MGGGGAAAAVAAAAVGSSRWKAAGVVRGFIPPAGPARDGALKAARRRGGKEARRQGGKPSALQGQTQRGPTQRTVPHLRLRKRRSSSMRACGATRAAAAVQRSGRLLSTVAATPNRSVSFSSKNIFHSASRASHLSRLAIAASPFATTGFFSTCANSRLIPLRLPPLLRILGQERSRKASTLSTAAPSRNPRGGCVAGRLTTAVSNG